MIDIKKMETREEREFDIYNDTRKFEIKLFWQRALFFGGFITIIFAGYSSKDIPKDVKFLLSILGALCSFVWFLANKGSKFWQENWEGHIAYSIYGSFFGIHYWKKDTKENRKSKIFNAERFSPSKLAIALSFYIIILWGILVISQYIDLTKIPQHRTIFLALTIAYAIYVFNSSKIDKIWRSKEDVWKTNDPRIKDK